MKKWHFLLVTIGLLLIDRLTKILVSSNMDLYQEIPLIKNFFSLLYIRNDGAAFSLFEGHMWLFYLATLIAIIVISYLFKTSKSNYVNLVLAIILAGVLGNFIDRLLYQEVIDFFSFTFGTYKFAIFNMADIYISIAVILYAIEILFLEKRAKNGNNHN